MDHILCTCSNQLSHELFFYSNVRGLDPLNTWMLFLDKYAGDWLPVGFAGEKREQAGRTAAETTLHSTGQYSVLHWSDHFFFVCVGDQLLYNCRSINSHLESVCMFSWTCTFGRVRRFLFKNVFVNVLTQRWNRCWNESIEVNSGEGNVPTDPARDQTFSLPVISQGSTSGLSWISPLWQMVWFAGKRHSLMLGLMKICTYW